MKKILIIAEKPSVAQDIMLAIEPFSIKNKNGHYVGEKYVIANSLGHLMELKAPNELFDLNEKNWSWDNIPFQFNLNKNIISYYKIKPNTKALFNELIKLLKKDFQYVINACDPDAEGEAIFRTLYEYSNSKLPMKRIFLEDLTSKTILKEINNLKSGEDLEGLRQRAYARAAADYLLGMNLTCSLTLSRGTLSNCGRVQTPTLLMVTDRYFEYKNYKESFSYSKDIVINDIHLKDTNLIFKEEQDAKNYKIQTPQNIEILVKKKKSTQPKLYDLSELQKWCNEKFDLSSSETLNIMQRFYEKKWTSYPRTDCQNITIDTKKDLEKLVEKKISNNVVGDVSAHYGIIPLVKKIESTNQIELEIFNEIMNVVVANTYEEIEYEQLTIKVGNHTKKINFQSTIGYSKVYKSPIVFEEKIKKEEVLNLHNKVLNDLKTSIIKIKSKRKLPFSEAQLLNAMQNIYTFISNKEAKKTLKNIKGIGTSATRSSIIKKLFDEDFICLKNKKIIPTQRGIDLINDLKKLDLILLNLEYSAILEEQLQDVEKNLSLKNFLQSTNKLCFDLTNQIKNNKVITKQNNNFLTTNVVVCNCNKCNKNIIEIKTRNHHFYKCEGCNLFFASKYLGAKISKSDLKFLLKNGQTKTKKLLKSKNNNSWESYVFLDKSMKYDFKKR